MVERFVSGLVGQAHGLNGMVKIRSLSGEQDHLAKLKHVCLKLSGTEKNYEIEDRGEISGTLLLKFRGIDSPEKARALSGAEILVDRRGAAPLLKNEFYVEDLKGLKVVLGNIDGREIGEVCDVIEGGGGYLVEIRLTSSRSLCLVPFRNEFFGEIEVKKGRAVLLEEWIIDEKI